MTNLKKRQFHTKEDQSRTKITDSIWEEVKKFYVGEYNINGTFERGKKYEKKVHVSGKSFGKTDKNDNIMVKENWTVKDEDEYIEDELTKDFILKRDNKTIHAIVDIISNSNKSNISDATRTAYTTHVTKKKIVFSSTGSSLVHKKNFDCMQAIIRFKGNCDDRVRIRKLFKLNDNNNSKERLISLITYTKA